MMDPTPDSIKTGQNCCDETTIDTPDKKKLRLHGELPPDYSRRFIPWRIIGKYIFPQRDHLGVISWFKLPDYDLCCQHMRL